MEELRANITLNFNSENALKQAEKTKDKFSDVSNSIKSSFTKTGLSVAGSLLTGFSMKKAYEETLKLSNLSEKFNLPIEEVSKFNNLMSQFGGNTNSTENALSNIQNAIIDLAMDGSGALKELGGRMALNPFKENGELKNSLEIIKEIKRVFNDLDPKGQIKLLDSLQMNTPEYLRLFRSSEEEFNKTVESASKMMVITEKQAENTIKLQRTLASIKQSFIGIGASSLEMINPLIDGVDWVLQKFNGLDDNIKKAIVSAITLSGVIKAIQFSSNFMSGLAGLGATATAGKTGILQKILNNYGKKIGAGKLAYNLASFGGGRTAGLKAVGGMLAGELLKTGSGIGAMSFALKSIWDNKPLEERSLYKFTRKAMDTFGIEDLATRRKRKQQEELEKQQAEKNYLEFSQFQTKQISNSSNINNSRISNSTNNSTSNNIVYNINLMSNSNNSRDFLDSLQGVLYNTVGGVR